ncbi:MAG: exodeoxyribonuclease VII large subunit [Spirochaetia bacterium]|nr:exodeoxyribonuclease VII large subunit [Spirochaetia bacterium]
MEELNYADEKPLSVFQVTNIVEDRLVNFSGLKNIAVIGEITEYNKNMSSGHIYFTLCDKDIEKSGVKKAVLRCTFFKFNNRLLNFQPETGMEVLVTGSISVYYQGGVYNFNVRQIQKVGEGALLLRIEKLRKKLIEEGIINPGLRKKLPFLPKRIGIVTGLGTAALRDILKQVKDRYPNVEVLIAPALVQGELAAKSIASAIDEISLTKYKCDLIILTRGGGSIEDLMPFNEEIVAYAIYKCPVPVISAIGHQIDHPISDDTADIAAATPTDGAKIALPVISDIIENLNHFQKRLQSLTSLIFNSYKEKWTRLAEKSFFKDPAVLIENYYLLLDDLENKQREGFRHITDLFRQKLLDVIDIHYLFERFFQNSKHLYEKNSAKLDAFSPLGTLKRGYSITFQNGKILNEAEKINLNKSIEIKFYKGKLEATPVKIIE